MNLSRKIYSSVLLLIVALPMCLVFLYSLHHFSKASTNKIVKHTNTLKLKEADFTWVKKGKEISIQGKLFDVSGFKIEQGMVTVTGYFDTEEDGLLSFFNSLFPEDNNEDFAPHQLLGLVFFPVNELYSKSGLADFANMSKPILCTPPGSALVNRAGEILHPPPDNDPVLL